MIADQPTSDSQSRERIVADERLVLHRRRGILDHRLQKRTIALAHAALAPVIEQNTAARQLSADPAANGGKPMTPSWSPRSQIANPRDIGIPGPRFTRNHPDPGLTAAQQPIRVPLEPRQRRGRVERPQSLHHGIAIAVLDRLTDRDIGRPVLDSGHRRRA